MTPAGQISPVAAVAWILMFGTDFTVNLGSVKGATAPLER
jgi:hypothetical protein